MHHGPELFTRQSKRDGTAAVAVNNRLNMRSRLIKSGVDESFQVWFFRGFVGGFPVESEFHDVAGFNQFGRLRARKQKTAGILRVAHAYVSKRVNDPLGRQDSIGDDKF